MLGTLAAAVIGPGIGQLARNVGGWPEFTGSFVALSCLLALSALVLAQLRLPPQPSVAAQGSGRSLREIAAQPGYRLAVLAGLVAYASMSFVMTATPLSMHVHDGISSAQTSLVISGHLLGMYLPSLASGWLSERLGPRSLLIWGVACMGSCVFISAIVGHEFPHYFAGLVLLGVGWNFMFVAATTLLTRTYTPVERFRAQGANDLAIFGAQATVSLLAGTAMEHLGWALLNISILPLLALAAYAAMTLRMPNESAARS